MLARRLAGRGRSLSRVAVTWENFRPPPQPGAVTTNNTFSVSLRFASIFIMGRGRAYRRGRGGKSSGRQQSSGTGERHAAYTAFDQTSPKLYVAATDRH